MHTVQFYTKNGQPPYILEEHFAKSNSATRWVKLIKKNGYKLKQVIMDVVQ